MTDKRNDGGPAFPKGYGQGNGMTLRDWLAGQALVGLLASPKTDGSTTNAHMAEVAHGLADAMLAERAKGGE